MTAPTLRRTSAAHGFTLVELMVAIAVLSIMLVGLATAMGYVSKLWLSGAGAMDNFTKARVVLNLLDRDIQMMVMRRDLAAFVDSTGSNSACQFYTNVQGNPGAGIRDSRALSLVQYIIATQSATPTLQRINAGMNFTTSGITPTVGTSTSLPANGTSQTDTVFTGIIQFQIQFIDGSGAILTPPYSYSSTPPTGDSPPTAPVPFWFDYTSPGALYNPRIVVVSMLVLSNPAYTIATQSSSTMAKLLADFPVGTSGALPSGMTSTTINGSTCATESYAQYWNSILNPATGTLDATLPVAVRSGIQVFERHVPLPVTTPSS